MRSRPARHVTDIEPGVGIALDDDVEGTHATSLNADAIEKDLHEARRTAGGRWAAM